MEEIKIKEGLIAKVVRRTDTEVELYTGGNANYIVFRDGKIISANYKHTGKCVELKVWINNNGYSTISICNTGKPRTVSVHRLVALCFIPNTHNLPHINHKNEIKTDNCVENLEWCDAKYNMNYGTAQERSHTKQINGKCSKPVKQLTLDGELVKIWPSTMEAQRIGGFRNAIISMCCNYKLKTHKGFKWEYINN